MTAPVRTTDPITVKVSLGARSYDIVIGRGLLGSLGTKTAALRPGARAAIVSDDNVAKLHLPATVEALTGAGLQSSTTIVAPGEGSKSFAVFEKVCEALIAAHMG